MWVTNMKNHTKKQKRARGYSFVPVFWGLHVGREFIEISQNPRERVVGFLQHINITLQQFRIGKF